MENFFGIFPLTGAILLTEPCFLGGGIMNRDMEQQVWQRVLGQQDTVRGSLRPMELEALEAAAVYRRLAGLFSGKERELLRRLYGVQMEMIACLRGIARLSGSPSGKPAQVPAPDEPAAKALEKRYHGARRAVTEYTARTVDGEFGIVFQHLADLSRDECITLARLLGEQSQITPRRGTK